MKNRTIFDESVQQDSEAGVIKVLKKHGLWDSKHWKVLGDNPQNQSIVHTQQSEAMSALAEKVTNAVDAVLENKMRSKGIDPASPDAPQSVKESVQKFMGIVDGDLSKLNAKSLRELAEENIHLTATGDNKEVCYTIIDRGVGQTPKDMESTFLSLVRGNKAGHKGLIGTFGMGSSGSLSFCGENGLQLILSRRSPKVVDNFHKGEAKADEWSFTIVRREDPKDGQKCSVYTYLAPNNEILSFKADALDLIPHRSEDGKLPMEHGSLVKLYNYKIAGTYKSNIHFEFNTKLNAKIPKTPLPVRLHELRPKFHGNSRSVTMSGLWTRLQKDSNSNLEEGFPLENVIRIEDSEIPVSIYVMKPGRAENYRDSEGVILMYNGQAQGDFKKSYFLRKDVNLRYIADDMIILLDCSKCSYRTIEKLFMNSRDRLRDGETKQKVKMTLARLLSTNDILKDLNETRRQDLLRDALKDKDKIENSVQNLFKKAKYLSQLFAGEGHKIKDIPPVPEDAFAGREVPTFFTLHKVTDPVYQGSKIWAYFKTDACNKYFDRDNFEITHDEGEFKLNIVVNSGSVSLIFTPLVTIPIGTRVNFEVKWEDPENDKLFVQPFGSTIQARPPKVDKPTQPKPKVEDKFSFKVPNVTEIWKSDPSYDRMKFSDTIAARVRESGDICDLFLNMDNVFLSNLRKVEKDTAGEESVDYLFKYGMIFNAMSIMNTVDPDFLEEKNTTISDFTEHCLSSIAPVIVPTVQCLGDLETDPMKLR